MQKEIIEVNKEKGIFRVTCVDERWYIKPGKEVKTGLPEYEFVPSVTWITSFYPKGIPFYKWLANHGWDEAESIKNAAGDRGTKVHKAVEDLIAGNKVKMDSEYLNKSTGKLEELTVDEYGAVLSFSEWWNTVKDKSKVIVSERMCWNAKEGYAGTVDLVIEIDGEIWLIDLKTSKNVWPEHEIQVSAYKHAKIEDVDFEIQKLGILQLGYGKNKTKKWKLTEIKDKFDLFLTAKKIWANETEGQFPFQKDYPLVIELAKKVEKIKAK